MKIFYYKISKKTCFIYWAQYMAGWSFNKEQSEKDYFLNIIGGLNDKEKIQLQKLKDFLSKENLGYSWLWDRYIDKPIKN